MNDEPIGEERAAKLMDEILRAMRVKDRPELKKTTEVREGRMRDLGRPPRDLVEMLRRSGAL